VGGGFKGFRNVVYIGGKFFVGCIVSKEEKKQFWVMCR
jgi:hypothetical protein